MGSSNANISRCADIVRVMALLWRTASSNQQPNITTLADKLQTRKGAIAALIVFIAGFVYYGESVVPRSALGRVPCLPDTLMWRLSLPAFVESPKSRRRRCDARYLCYFRGSVL